MPRAADERNRVLTREQAISFGVTGPSGRASGWACDVRKVHPYGVYEKVAFTEIVREDGDVFGRYKVRLDEIRESLRILEQLIDAIPEGAYAVKTKPILKLPEGVIFPALRPAGASSGFLSKAGARRIPIV